jgi:hypothetical protein
MLLSSSRPLYSPTLKRIAQRTTSSTLCRTNTTLSIPHEPLPRSIPHKSALLLLHIPVPPSLWPPKLESTFPLLSSLSLNLSPNIAINAIYDGHSHDTHFHNGGYDASLHFPDRHVVRFKGLVEGDERLGEALRWGVNGVKAKEVEWEGDGEGEREILVCTHGSRDCRCKDRGGGLVDALREEIERRGVGGKVKVREIAHVGGHK